MTDDRLDQLIKDVQYLKDRQAIFDGGAVALETLTAGRTPIKAVALVNPAVRIRSVVGLLEAMTGSSGEMYPWTAEAHRTADELDFVARAGDGTAQPPLLLVSGELDHPTLRTDVAALVPKF